MIYKNMLYVWLGCKLHTAWSAAWSNLNMKWEEVDASCGEKGDRNLFPEGEDHGKHIQLICEQNVQPPGCFCVLDFSGITEHHWFDLCGK
jgi:hypothetical protein